jgi:hypothetical protein
MTDFISQYLSEALLLSPLDVLSAYIAISSREKKQ